MIDRGYARIAELDDAALINRYLDQMTGKDSLRAFYINQIKEKRHVSDFNHEKTMKIIQRIINNNESELRELEYSEIILLDTLFCFMVEVWKFLNSNGIPLSQKNKFVRTLSDGLKMLVKRASGKEIKETNMKLCSFLNSLEQFQEKLDSQEPYSHEYISFLKWLEDSLKNHEYYVFVWSVTSSNRYRQHRKCQ